MTVKAEKSIRPSAKAIAFLLLSPPAVLVFVMISIVLAWFAASKIFPAHPAAFYIKKVDATVGLKFYWIWNETRDNRYLTVRTPQGTVTYPMCGFDWAHWSRTNIYLAGDQKIASWVRSTAII
jgi:hypothetical protein